MKQYIDKAALVAEIEKLKEEYALCPTRNNYEDGLKEGRLIGYKDALNKINTFEVREVDLDKELKNLDDTLFDLDGVAVKGATSYLTVEDVKDIAKHFFELELKTRKGE